MLVGQKRLKVVLAQAVAPVDHRPGHDLDKVVHNCLDLGFVK